MPPFCVTAPAPVTLKLAFLIILSYPVPIFNALNVLLAIGVTLGRLIALRVLALALALVVPVGVIESPFTVVEVAEAFAFVNV